MAPIVSVHLADIGVAASLRLQVRPPQPARIPGLRHADVGIAAPLSAKVRAQPTVGRSGLVAFWDDEPSLERFLADHPLARTLAGGWSARLEPVRAFGRWPGLPDDLARARRIQPEGLAVVLTLGRLRVSQAPRFLRTSAQAEGAVVGAPGVLFATGLARPPFVATCSVWESDDALTAYAYGDKDGGAHPGAITEDRRKPFHKQSAFVRLRVLRMDGSLGAPTRRPRAWSPADRSRGPQGAGAKMRLTAVPASAAGPHHAIRPRSSTATRSQRASAWPTFCSTTRRAAPSPRRRSRPS